MSARESDQPRPVLLIWSGGKDCLMALEYLHMEPRWQVVALVCTMIDHDAHVIAHHIPAQIVREQARLLGLPLYVMPVRCSRNRSTWNGAHHDS